MLETLMELEVAYSIVQSVYNEKDVHYIDAYYARLRTDIQVLDKTSEEFKTIELYVTNTHAETHKSYDLEIVQVIYALF